MDFLVATGLLLIFVLLSWSYALVLSGVRPLSVFKRRLLTLTTLFAAGMVYSMLIISDLNWPKALIFPVIGLWAAAVVFIAWWRYRKRNEPARVEQEPPLGCGLQKPRRQR